MFFRDKHSRNKKRLRIYYIEKGIVVVPDFITNAGGVIMAAMEYAKKIEKVCNIFKYS